MITKHVLRDGRMGTLGTLVVFPLLLVMLLAPLANGREARAQTLDSTATQVDASLAGAEASTGAPAQDSAVSAEPDAASTGTEPAPVVGADPLSTPSADPASAAPSSAPSSVQDPPPEPPPEPPLPESDPSLGSGTVSSAPSPQPSGSIRTAPSSEPVPVSPEPAAPPPDSGAPVVSGPVAPETEPAPSTTASGNDVPSAGTPVSGAQAPEERESPASQGLEPAASPAASEAADLRDGYGGVSEKALEGSAAPGVEARRTGGTEVRRRVGVGPASAPQGRAGVGAALLGVSGRAAVADTLSGAAAVVRRADDLARELVRSAAGAHAGSSRDGKAPLPAREVPVPAAPPAPAPPPFPSGGSHPCGPYGGSAGACHGGSLHLLLAVLAGIAVSGLLVGSSSRFWGEVFKPESFFPPVAERPG